jgi:hypothetical protein
MCKRRGRRKEEGETEAEERGAHAQPMRGIVTKSRAVQR